MSAPRVAAPTVAPAAAKQPQQPQKQSSIKEWASQFKGHNFAVLREIVTYCKLLRSNTPEESLLAQAAQFQKHLFHFDDSGDQTWTQLVRKQETFRQHLIGDLRTVDDTIWNEAFAAYEERLRAIEDIHSQVFGDD